MSFEVFDTKEKGRGLKALKAIKIGVQVLEEAPDVCILCNNVRRHFCSHCFVPNDERLLRCSGCSFVRYCGQQCQRQAWKAHKHECKRIPAVAPRVPTDLVRLMYKILQMKAANQDMDWYDNLVPNVNKIGEKRKEDFVSIVAVLGHFSGREFIMKFTASEIFELFAKVSCNSFSVCNGEMQSIGM